MYTYKIFRLIVIIFMITYFIGCFWWLLARYVNTPKDIEKGNTFIEYFQMNQLFDSQDCLDLHCISDDPDPLCDDKDWLEENCGIRLQTQVIIVCYYALTTLSTVGYGDYYPISRNEKIVGCILMLVGITFFAQIIGSFIEIIQSYDQSMGNEEMGSSLNSWMTLLSRFTDKPLSKALVNSIDQHYTYFWANDRLNSMKKDDEFLNQCPRVVKRHVLLNYLYDDVIFKHRLFFLTT